MVRLDQISILIPVRHVDLFKYASINIVTLSGGYACPASSKLSWTPLQAAHGLERSLKSAPMFELSSFFAALGVYVIGTVSPGPANLTIANTSLNYGRTPGLVLAAGVISGSLCWGAMTAAGVSALLMSNPQI